jgi:hypothetical protein
MIFGGGKKFRHIRHKRQMWQMCPECRHTIQAQTAHNPIGVGLLCRMAVCLWSAFGFFLPATGPRVAGLVCCLGTGGAHRTG